MQNGHKIFIKGMVCDRCILTIRNELHALQVPVFAISLGEVSTVSALTSPDRKAIEQCLLPLGFTLLEDKKAKLIRDVKSLVEKVYSGSFDFPDNFSFFNLMTSSFYTDYQKVSSIFSSSEGISIEKYVMGYRIEKVKELLADSPDPLTDIAYRLGYNSVAHLSTQFKINTGITPSQYKKVRALQFGIISEYTNAQTIYLENSKDCTGNH